MRYSSNVTTTSQTNLTAAQIFKFRVPHSTVELQITANRPIDGNELRKTLLAIHDYTGDHIESQGDSPLAPRDDPFAWDKSGPPPQTGVYLKAQSAKDEQMTWSVLHIAVEGLFLALPAVGRNYEAQFDIWDWRPEAQGGGYWGFGEVKSLSLTEEESLLKLPSSNYTSPGGAVVERAK